MVETTFLVLRKAPQPSSEVRRRVTRLGCVRWEYTHGALRHCPSPRSCGSGILGHPF